ncbi:MAG: hypothetical protein ACYCW6_30755 [Candidatus Xenobia bacterium]
MESLTLFCQVCRWPGEPGADNCAYCGRWLVVPDPHPPQLPRCRVGNPLSALWDVSCRVARGQAPSEALQPPLFDMLAKWQEFRDLPTLPPVMKASIEACTQALADMHAFVATRQVALLNAAWGRLLPAAEVVWELSRATGLVNDNTQSWFTTDDLIMAFDNPED